MAPKKKNSRARGPDGTFLPRTAMSDNPASGPEPSTSIASEQRPGSETAPRSRDASLQPTGAADSSADLPAADAAAPATPAALAADEPVASTEQPTPVKKSLTSAVPAKRKRPDSLAPMCMRCTNFNTEAATSSRQIQDDPCVLRAAHLTRCTRCAKSNKQCVMPASDIESRRLALEAQVTRQACYDATSLLAASETLDDETTDDATQAFLNLRTYVFRDSSAVVPGGVSLGKSRKQGATPAVGSDVVSELRRLREDIGIGFSKVINVMEEIRDGMAPTARGVRDDDEREDPFVKVSKVAKEGLAEIAEMSGGLERVVEETDV